MDSMIPIRQKNTLAEYMILFGADNRPPMLDKDLYDSWKSIMELYMQNREHGRMILESVKHGPLIWPTIEENGVTRTNKYAKLSATEKIQADCDLKNCHGSMGKNSTTNARMKLEHFQVNTKFLNSLPPEWSKFVTDVKLIDFGLAVPVFKQGDDPIYAINKMMSFMSTVITSRFSTTNNQLRNSSNPRQEAIIHDGRVTVQPVQGRQGSFVVGTSGTRANISRTYRNNSGQQRVMKCFNCQGEGHMARQCPKRKRKRDATWFRDKVLLVEAQGNGKVINEEELEFLADPRIAEGPATQTVITHNASYQADDLNAYDSDYDDFSTAKAVLMASLASYGSDILSENAAVQDKSSSAQQDAIILSVFEQLSNQEKDAKNIDTEIALEKKIKELDNIVCKIGQSAQTTHMIMKPQVFYDNNLKQALGFQNSFYLKKAQQIRPMLYDGSVIAKETNVISIADSEETDEESRSKMLLKQRDPMVLKQKVSIKPINYAELNRLYEDFGKRFVPQQELSDEQAFWLQTLHPNVDQSASSPVKIEAPRELPKASLYLELEAELIKQHNMVENDEYNRLSKSFSKLEQHCISLELAMQLNKEIFQKNNTSVNQTEPSFDQFSMFDARHELCFLEFVSDMNASSKSKSVKKAKKKEEWKPTGKVITATNKVPLREPIPLEVTTQESVVTKVYTKRPKVVQIVLWYLDFGCSKHMTGDRSQLTNFVHKFLGNVKFGNDQIAKIMGYGDYQIGNITISRVYYVEEGVDLLSGSRETNLYTLSIGDMMASSPICLLSKASKTKSWLWHRRLSHLNFACAMGKSKKQSHKPKSEDTNQEKLYLLYIDLCGPMRVASVNGKKYLLLIVDDYSRLTWGKFLTSKDEALDFIIKFLKMIQVRLNATVRIIRTDNETEFVNQTLRDYYEQVGISHETSVARTRQQNGVVKRRNRTLVEAARTMLIFAQAPLFLWAKAVATACIFIGSAPKKKAYHIYNRRTRKIIETISVNFDELAKMASEQLGSGPELQSMTPATSSSGLVPNPIPQQPCIPPPRNDWDHLFQPMFDEYFNPSTIVVFPVPIPAAPRAVDLADSPVSSLIDQDASSTRLQISQSLRGIFLNKSKYAFEIIEKYGLLTSDSVDTPMVEKNNLDEDLQGKPVDATLYRGMIGSLMYLTSNRPDLIYAVCLCARWSSKKQKSTVISSTKAEYIALSGCCAQILWMRSQLTDYGFQFNKIPLYCDNKSEIALCCNNVQHSRAKHINVRYHFTKEQVENVIVELYFVQTEYQLADIITKPFSKRKIQFLDREARYEKHVSRNAKTSDIGRGRVKVHNPCFLYSIGVRVSALM
ncbi:retrovirus-related pol polyprotein from transposon TNT 1-94 [Tanacetum coccineum]|uniref:Retrovirus-related pol polyprotein from transposon TNT 1-94 n=1 Tax=Tanacetum coccineum TaxID=301880 RepID=A0ABQ5F7H7_9ASTR